MLLVVAYTKTLRLGSNTHMSGTNLRDNLINFSNGWEGYVNECMRLVNDQFRFYVTKDHFVYQLLINTIVSELEGLVDQRIYKVKGSVGQSSLTGIPWLSVMDKNITESTQSGFYISYLFSKNAKKLHLSIALGATQFEELFGANSKTTGKIIQAKEQFVQNFVKYAPADSFGKMDLLDLEDKNFVRAFSPTMVRIADYYSGGSFFTKTYDLVNPDFTEAQFVSDFKMYVETYRKLALDPVSTALLEVLDESVHDEADEKKNASLDYELPRFDPTELEAKTVKTKKGNSTSSNRRPSVPSKKVGDAGERYVFEYEKNKLINCGQQELADRIVKQYENLSSFPGYDIQSFDKSGKIIYIEVKSSKNKKKDYFEISENEIKAAKRLGDDYYIYQVTNALIDPQISTVIKNVMSYEKDNRIRVEPMVYRISFKNQK